MATIFQRARRQLESLYASLAGGDGERAASSTSGRDMNGRTAWENLLRSDSGRWEAGIARLHDPLAEVAHTPKFRLSPHQKFFCIGSCFARNIEEHLIYNDVEVLSKQINIPKAEWPNRPNGIVNKVTTASILNELNAVVGGYEVDADSFEETQAGWVDLQLIRSAPVPLARAIERRRYIVDSYFARLRFADVVVLTLGLIEVWEDRKTGRFLNAAPTFASVKREPDRYRLVVTTVAENVKLLEQIWRRLCALNPNVCMIVTVSPVPMSHTFSGRDILVANTLSKSVLRASAEVLVSGKANVDYFPSFDMVANSPKAAAFDPDCLHVDDRIVGRVTRKFLRDYFGLEPKPIEFSELAYLQCNPDVDEAVRRGTLISGYHHWRQYGRIEQRIMGAGEKTDYSEMEDLL